MCTFVHFTESQDLRVQASVLGRRALSVTALWCHARPTTVAARPTPSVWREEMVVSIWQIFCIFLTCVTYRHWLTFPTNKNLKLCCPTLTKGSNWQITHIWESDVFRLDLSYFTSIPNLEQKHSTCWTIFKSRHNDTALMSVYMTDTFFSFTRNVIFKSCFLLSEYGRTALMPSVYLIWCRMEPCGTCASK